MKTKAQTIAKWTKGVSTGQSAYVAGVQSPTRDWATATAGAADRWSAGVAQAASDGKFASGVQAPGVDAKWKANASGKGATRWQTSVNEKAVKDNYARGLDKLFGYIESALGVIASMPTTTPADRDARMLAYINAMRAAKTAHP